MIPTRKAVRLFVLRCKMGQQKLIDLVHGTITFDASLLAEDFVILKADGFPTYNFACVVDDAEMGITHIIGEMTTYRIHQKQIALYNAFGF